MSHATTFLLGKRVLCVNFALTNTFPRTHCSVSSADSFLQKQSCGRCFTVYLVLVVPQTHRFILNLQPCKYFRCLYNDVQDRTEGYLPLFAPRTTLLFLISAIRMFLREEHMMRFLPEQVPQSSLPYALGTVALLDWHGGAVRRWSHACP